VLCQRLKERLEDLSRHACGSPAPFQFGDVAALMEDEFPSLDERSLGLCGVLLQHFRSIHLKTRGRLQADSRSVVESKEKQVRTPRAQLRRNFDLLADSSGDAPMLSAERELVRGKHASVNPAQACCLTWNQRQSVWLVLAPDRKYIAALRSLNRRSVAASLQGYLHVARLIAF
jgi:hypothetical protein